MFTKIVVCEEPCLTNGYDGWCKECPDRQGCEPVKDEDETMEKLKAVKGQEPRILKSKNSDEPSCPICGGYNAMLHFVYYDGVYSRKCRSCGHAIINTKVIYNTD